MNWRIEFVGGGYTEVMCSLTELAARYDQNTIRNIRRV